MSLKSTILIGTMAVVTAGILYQIKYAVRAEERELKQVREQIDEEFWRIRTLQADWAWLTRPERVATQAIQLGMEPVRVERIVTADSLGYADHLQFAGRMMAVELEDGIAAEIQFRPIPAALVKPGRVR